MPLYLSRSLRALGPALALSAALGVSSFSAPAAAQTPDQIKAAKAQAGEGLEAYQKNEYEKAQKLFADARTVYPSAQVIRMQGYAEVSLERWAQAADDLEASMEAKLSPLSKEDKKDVQEQLAKALAHLGLVNVKSRVPGAEVAIDDGDFKKLPLDKPIRLTEGKHKIVVKAPDRLDAKNDVLIEPGKTAEIALDPAEKPKEKVAEPPPPPPPVQDRKEWIPNQRMVGYGAIAGGGALFATGLIMGLIGVHNYGLASDAAAAHTQSFGNKCAKGDLQLCTLDVELTNNEAQKATSLKSAGLGLGIAGGLVAAAGVVFVVMAPKSADKPKDEGAPPPAAKGPGLHRLACGPMGGLGVSCSGAF